MRVYTKARELGVTSRALLHYLARKGCRFASASCNLTDEALAAIPTDSIMVILREMWLSRPPDDLPYPPWPQLVTTYQASRIAQVTPATIRQWRRRRKLVPADLRGRSKSSVYYLKDVLEVRLSTRHARRNKIPVYRVPFLDAQTYDTVMTARQASAHMNIPESTIRSWAHRKRVLPVSFDGRSPQYRLREIYQLIKGRQRPELDLPDPDQDDWDD